MNAALTNLAERFESQGHRLFLVGGCVRDALLGRPLSADYDLATDAPPETVKQPPHGRRRRAHLDGRRALRHDWRAPAGRDRRDHHVSLRRVRPALAQARSALRKQPGGRPGASRSDDQRPGPGPAHGRVDRSVRRRSRPAGANGARRRKPGPAIRRGPTATAARGAVRRPARFSAGQRIQPPPSPARRTYWRTSAASASPRRSTKYWSRRARGTGCGCFATSG